MANQTDDDLDTLLAQFAPAVLESLNQHYEDAAVFVARILGSRPELTAAQAVGVDRFGLDLAVGDETLRIDFLEPVTQVDQLTGALLALVLHARELSGEEGATSIERVQEEMNAIRTFLTEVSSVEEVHPHLRRITFRGGDLATFTPGGPDTFLYVLLPPPGRTELTIDQSFSWSTVGDMAPEEQPVGAYYTLRHWRPETHELEMLFVLHDPAGPACEWAARAKPGDPVALWGPRTAWEPPATTDWYLLVADDTGLPAVATIIESLPEGMPVRVFAEVADAGEHQELSERDGVEVTWLHREGAAAGTTTLLVDAVRVLPWPGGSPYVWGGGESRAMTAVRKYVRNEVGLDREAVSLVAYWRHAAHVADPVEEE